MKSVYALALTIYGTVVADSFKPGYILRGSW
jgi:hypothetical protein